MGKALMGGLVLAIVLMLSSFPLSSWANTHAMLRNPYSNSAVTNKEEKQSVFIQECRCPGFPTPLCPKESIVLQKFFSGIQGKTIISVSNTCAMCSANQIILDCSSILPPDLLFPYCDVNDAKPIMPFHNWVSTYQGSIDAPITVLQANFTCLH